MVYNLDAFTLITAESKEIINSKNAEEFENYQVAYKRLNTALVVAYKEERDFNPEYSKFPETLKD